MSRDTLKISLDKRNTSATKQMVTRGLPKSILAYPSFRLEDKATSFVSQVEGLRDKRIEKSKQIDSIKKLIEDPFLGPYVACISGSPHDVNAKLLGAYIMMQAVNMQANKEELSKKQKRTLKDKSFPIWHNLYGGFDNPLVTKENNSIHKPSLIIISNVTLDSTGPKIEKLRDILEAYSSIPRIVIASGTDPLTLFHSRLYSNLNFCCHLGSSLTKKSHVL